MCYEHLKLENQLCFRLYAVSRLIIRAYQPFLDEMGITYPQYLVLLVLWEEDAMPVNDIAKRLILNTSTITPLLKRMESDHIITRERNKEDERKVIVRLSEKGQAMRESAAKIPEQMISVFDDSKISTAELVNMKPTLDAIIEVLNQDQK